MVLHLKVFRLIRRRLVSCLSVLGVLLLVLALGLPQSSNQVKPSIIEIQVEPEIAKAIQEQAHKSVNYPAEVLQKASSEEKVNSKLDSVDLEKAKELFTQEGYEEAPIPTELKWVKRRRFVDIDPEAVKGEIFNFKPFPGHDYQVVPTSVNNIAEGQDAVIGELFNSEGEPVGDVTLAVVDGPDGFGYSGRFTLADGTNFLVAHDESGRTVVRLSASHV